MKTNIFHISLPDICLQETITFYFQLFLLYIILFKLTTFHCIVYLILMKFEIFPINFYVYSTWPLGNTKICFSSSFLCTPYLLNWDQRIFQTNFISCLNCFSKSYPVHGTKKILVDSLGAWVVQLQTDSSSRTSLGLLVLNLEPSSFWLFSSRLWNTFGNFLRMMGGREMFSWIYSCFIVFLERSFWLWLLPLKSALGRLSFLWRWKSLKDFSILPLSLGFGNYPKKCFRWGGHF